MPISKTWPSGGTNPTPTTYQIPLNTELNWTTLTTFLQALADSAQGTSFQKFAMRRAIASPVAVVATTDCMVVTDLTVAGAVVVNLPAGADKQLYFIFDGKGDAATNNITINRAGADTIRGATSIVIDRNYGGVILSYNAASTDWKAFGPFITPGGVIPADFVGILPTTKGGTGVNGTATFPGSGTVAIYPISLTADVTGTLPVANGGTGITSLGAGVATWLGTPSSANLASAVTDETGSGALVFATSPTLVTPALGTPTSGILTNATGLPLTTGVTGTLPIGNGGTGQTTANTALNALLPTQTSSANKFLRTDGTNTLWATATGGAGEVNAVLNASGADGTTGWTGTTVVSGASSPLNPIITTAFSIVNAATPQTSTTGGYYPFTMPTGLQNKKLKVEFTFTSPATDVYQVSVYTGTTRVPLTTDASGVTALPANTTGKFTAYFDSDNTTSWTVGVTRTSGSTGAVIITNVIVGPGIQPQGAVVGEWESWTPTVNNAGSKTFTNTGFWRQVGSSMEMIFKLTSNNVAAGAGAGVFQVNLPTGYNIPSNYQYPMAVGSAGTFGLLANSQFDRTVQVSADTAATLAFLKPATSDYYAQSDLNVAYATEFYAHLSVPIAEWAGAGTVNVAQNDVEFAYNTSGDVPAGDTTSFGYGPNGVAFVVFSAAQQKRVRFQTPIQVGDQIQLQISADSGTTWRTVGQNGDYSGAYSVQGATDYGIGAIATVSGSVTDVTVNIGLYRLATGVTYGAAGAAWVSGAANRWRLVKSSAGAAVGFGIVVPGTSSGLVSASGLPGRTDNSVIAASYVGEEAGQTTASGVTWPASGSTKTVTSRIFTKGSWLVWGDIEFAFGSAYVASAASSANLCIATLSTTTDTYVDSTRGYAGIVVFAVASSLAARATTRLTFFRFSSDTTVYVTGTIHYTSQTGGTMNGAINGIRIG